MKKINLKFLLFFIVSFVVIDVTYANDLGPISDDSETYDSEYQLNLNLPSGSIINGTQQMTDGTESLRYNLQPGFLLREPQESTSDISLGLQQYEDDELVIDSITNNILRRQREKCKGAFGNLFHYISGEEEKPFDIANYNFDTQPSTMDYTAYRYGGKELKYCDPKTKTCITSALRTVPQDDNGCPSWLAKLMDNIAPEEKSDSNQADEVDLAKDNYLQTCCDGSPICKNNNFLEGGSCDLSEDSVVDVDDSFSQVLSRVTLVKNMEIGTIPGVEDSVGSEGGEGKYRYARSFCDKCLVKVQDSLNESSSTDLRKLEGDILRDLNSENEEENIKKATKVEQGLMLRKRLLRNYYNSLNEEKKKVILDYFAEEGRKISSVDDEREIVAAMCGDFDKQVRETSSKCSQDEFDNGMQKVIGSLLPTESNEHIADIDELRADITAAVLDNMDITTSEMKDELDKLTKVSFRKIGRQLHKNYERIKSLCSDKDFHTSQYKTHILYRVIAGVSIVKSDKESLRKVKSIKRVFDRVKSLNPELGANLGNPKFICNLLSISDKSQLSYENSDEGAVENFLVKNIEAIPVDGFKDHFKELEKSICFEGTNSTDYAQKYTDFVCNRTTPSSRALEDYRVKNKKLPGINLAISRLKCISYSEQPNQKLSFEVASSQDVHTVTSMLNSSDDEGQFNSAGTKNGSRPTQQPSIWDFGYDSSTNKVVKNRGPSLTHDQIKNTIVKKDIEKNNILESKTLAGSNNGSIEASGSEKSVLKRVMEHNDSGKGSSGQNLNSGMFSDNSYLSQRTLAPEVVEEVIKTDPAIQSEVQSITQKLGELDPQNPDPNQTVSDILSGKQTDLFPAGTELSSEKSALQSQIDELRKQLVAKTDNLPAETISSLEKSADKRRIAELEQIIASMKNEPRGGATGLAQSGGRALASLKGGTETSIGRVSGGELFGHGEKTEIAGFGQILNQTPAPENAKTLLNALGTTYQIEFQNDKLVLRQGNEKIPLDFDDIVVENGQLKRIVYKGSIIDVSSMPEESVVEIEKFIQKSTPELFVRTIEDAIERLSPDERLDGKTPSEDAVTYNQLLCEIGDSSCQK